MSFVLIRQGGSKGAWCSAAFISCGNRDGISGVITQTEIILLTAQIMFSLMKYISGQQEVQSKRER